jgi:hypothetical protein
MPKRAFNEYTQYSNVCSTWHEVADAKMPEMRGAMVAAPGV